MSTNIKLFPKYGRIFFKIHIFVPLLTRTYPFCEMKIPKGFSRERVKPPWSNVWKNKKNGQPSSRKLFTRSLIYFSFYLIIKSAPRLPHFWCPIFARRCAMKVSDRRRWRLYSLLRHSIILSPTPLCAHLPKKQTIRPTRLDERKFLHEPQIRSSTHSWQVFLFSMRLKKSNWWFWFETIVDV